MTAYIPPTPTSPEIDALRASLAVVRQASIEATRRGQWLKVAKLTSAAATLNRRIFDAECALMEEGACES